MAVSLLHYNISGNTPSATAPSVAINWTPAAGNTLLVGFYANPAATNTFSTPTGWNYVNTILQGSGYASIALFSKQAVGNETSVASTITGSTNSIAVVYEFAGVSVATDAFGLTSTNTNSPSTETVTSTAISPTVIGQLYFALFGAGGGTMTSQTWTTSTSMTLANVNASNNYYDGWGVTTSTASQTSTLTWGTTSTSPTLLIATFDPATGAVNASITQVAATLTFTGGTQAIASIQDSSISQVGATLTLTGGTQSIATVQDVSIGQSYTTLTFSGGTQSIATINDVSIAQVAATLTFTGGTQVSATIQDVGLSQIAALLTLSGGTQAVSATQLGSVNISQVGANLTFNGGIQVVSATVITTANNYTFSDGSGIIRLQKAQNLILVDDRMMVKVGKRVYMPL